MAVTDYATLIAAARNAARDPANGRPVFRETPQGNRDGVNTVFILSHQNIVKGLIASVQYGPFYTYGTSNRAITGFTTDAANGIVTITAAPDTTTQPFCFDYWYQLFTDAEYTEFIDRATEEFGITAGTATATNLYPALIQYVIERFWTARASMYADKYATSAGSQAESIQTVTASYLSLAKAARAKALDMRKAAGATPEGKATPFSGTVVLGMDPYTPPR